MLTWKKRPREEFLSSQAHNSHLLMAGKQVGGMTIGGRVCTLLKKRLQVPRVIWVMQTGMEPGKGRSIVPANGNLNDMRWSNLVEVKYRSSENLRTYERKLIKVAKKRAKLIGLDNISYNGFALQPWSARCGKWNLGRFDKKNEAEKALARALGVGN
jgi:hypothetical protein